MLLKWRAKESINVSMAAMGIFIKRKVDKRAAQKHQLSDETADNKYGKE